MRFNHMELTFPVGTLTTTLREEIDDFYGSVFGWKGFDTDVVGQSCHLLMPDADQFILLAESNRPMSSPGYDHLGLLQDTRQEVDELLKRASATRTKDDRVSIERRRGPGLSGPDARTPSTSTTFCRSRSTCTARSPRRAPPTHEDDGHAPGVTEM